MCSNTTNTHKDSVLSTTIFLTTAQTTKLSHVFLDNNALLLKVKINPEIDENSGMILQLEIIKRDNFRLF